jgi:hypothetical protein
MRKHQTIYRGAAAIWLGFASVVVGMLVFLAGEATSNEWLAQLGGWITLPATAALALFVLVAAAGYALAALITAASWLGRVLRR